jgi:hypothetical protein
MRSAMIASAAVGEFERVIRRIRSLLRHDELRIGRRDILAQNSDGVQIHAQQLFPNSIEPITLFTLHMDSDFRSHLPISMNSSREVALWYMY